MKKNQNKILLITAIIVLLIIGISYCVYETKYKNTKITDITILIKQNSKVVKINDSLQGVEQFTLITDDKKVIFNLQDSNQKLLAELIKLKNVQAVVSYKETFNQNNIIGKLQDTFVNTITNLEAKIKELAENKITEEQFKEYKKSLLATKIKYKTVSPYIYDVGTIDFYGSKTTDTLEIKSESHLTIGETRKNIFYKPKITALISNKNPYVKITDVKSVVYVPKNKWEVSAGPSILINRKGANVGIGVNIKKGFFSINVGYKVF